MKNKTTVGRTWVRLAVKALIIVVILWISFGVCLGLRRVSSITMNGRINDGDFVLFDRMKNTYNAGDVVFYTHDGKELLSEIIGVEDDLILVDDEGFLLVNGEVITDAPVYDFTLGETNPFSNGFRVPAGTYFVLNSNYEITNDSRSFGAINAKDIKGSIIALMLRTRGF